jgi:uncharacterized protein YraI
MRHRLLGLVVLGGLVASTALAQTAITRKTVNLRAGPSVEYPVVNQIPPGIAVLINGCLDDWTWCDATVGPDRGWVYAGNLYYPYEGSQVIIRSYGPTIGLPIITFSVGPYWDLYYRTRPWYHRRSYWVGRPPPPHWHTPPHQGRPSNRPPAHHPRPPVNPARPAPKPPASVKPARPAPRPQPAKPHPAPARPAPKPHGPGPGAGT